MCFACFFIVLYEFRYLGSVFYWVVGGDGGWFGSIFCIVVVQRGRQSLGGWERGSRVGLKGSCRICRYILCNQMLGIVLWGFKRVVGNLSSYFFRSIFSQVFFQVWCTVGARGRSRKLGRQKFVCVAFFLGVFFVRDWFYKSFSY